MSANQITNAPQFGSSPIIRTRVKTRPEKKLRNFNIVLDQDGVDVVNNIKDRIYPSTKTEVFRSALNVLNIIFTEVDSGTVFYVKRNKSTKYEEFQFVE